MTVLRTAPARRSSVRVLIVALVVALGAAACGSDSEEPRGATDDETSASDIGSIGGSAGGLFEGRDLVESPRPSGTLEFSGCGSSVECATLEVPLDHDDPAGDTIELAVARRHAVGPGPRLGVLLLNPGGPGASGVSYLRAIGDLGGLAEWFDLVSWDPRGVGESTAVRCDDELMTAFRTMDHRPRNASEQAALEDAAEAFATSCEQRSGALLAHVGTTDTIDDMDALRVALGEEQINFLGASYGTFLGQHYAERYPQRVRAMVLDGVVDPAADAPDLLSAQALAFEEVLDGTLDACGSDPSCPVQDPHTAFDALAEQLASAPLSGAGGRPVTPTALAIGSLMPGYDSSLTQSFHSALARALDGDGAPLDNLARIYWSVGSYPAYIATLCLDLEHPVDAAAHEQFATETTELAPRLGPAVANEVLPCAFWPHRAAPDATPLQAPDAPPILVIGNTGDAATPVELARRVADQLATGVLIVHEGDGHTSFSSSPCVRDEVLTYLVEVVPPPEGTVCES